MQKTSQASPPKRLAVPKYALTMDGEPPGDAQRARGRQEKRQRRRAARGNARERHQEGHQRDPGQRRGADGRERQAEENGRREREKNRLHVARRDT